MIPGNDGPLARRSMLPYGVTPPAQLRMQRTPGARRVLLLTSGLGSGHARAATAMQEAWRAVDPQVQVHTLDFWSVVDPDVTRILQQGYLRLVDRHPELYDRIFCLDRSFWRSVLGGAAIPKSLQRALCMFECNLPGSRHASGRIDRWLLAALIGAFGGPVGGWPAAAVRHGLVRSAYRRLSLRLRSRIQAFAPDLIVVNQMLPAALLSPWKVKGAVTAPVVGVLTDYGAHYLWAQPGIDHFCVASEDMRTSLRAAGTRAERISVTGIPLMPEFRHPPPQPEARRELGLDPDCRAVLLLGGGLGLGVEEAARQIVASGADVTCLVVTGNNRAARNRLEALAAPARLRVFGWTERMALMIRAADVVVGKPGGLTVAEAMACGRPLVATHCLLGQEGFNVRFLEAHDTGGLVPAPKLAAILGALLADRDRLASMQERAWELGRRDSARQVICIAMRLGGGLWQPHGSGDAMREAQLG